MTAPRARRVAPVELPTVLLIVATYAGWLWVTHAYRHWPLMVVVPVTTILIVLHGSVQHEVLHGHPTRWTVVNRLLAIVPLTLWLPFIRYRQNHLAHHTDARLTDPLDDPESFYWRPEDLAKSNPITRALLRIQQTLAGRVIVGSVWHVVTFLLGDLRDLARDKNGIRLIWMEHLLWCVPVVLWLKWVCSMPLWLYFFAMAIPANGMVLIRSFAEHRALPEVRQRIATVERSWILGPLFLFNNLHSLHHESPWLPWYQYNARYRAERGRLLAENGGLVYDSYLEVARRFLFRPHDALEHPTGRVPKDSAGSGQVGSGQAGSSYPAALAARSQSNSVA